MISICYGALLVAGVIIGSIGLDHSIGIASKKWLLTFIFGLLIGFVGLMSLLSEIL
jgi:hypothetical protein